MTSRILTVTLNPAIDISADVEKISSGPKLRCENPRYEPGGGGVNVARVIHELGGDAQAFVVVGGGTGQWLIDMLEATGIDAIPFDVGCATRTSIHICERASGDLFRFVFPGEAVEAGLADRLRQELARRIDDLGTGYFVQSGSLLPGMTEAILPELVARCRDRGVRYVVDSTPAALASLAGSGCFLVKQNDEEIERLRNMMNWPDAPLPDIARRLLDNGTAEIVVVTKAASGAILVTRELDLHLPAPVVPIVSQVGAGDSFMAALVLGIAEGWPIKDAFRYGMAAGAAAVLTPGSVLACKDDVDRIFAEI